MKSFIGILGSVIFGFGIVGFFFAGQTFSLPIVSLHLIIGLILVLVWFFTSGVKNLSNASGAVMGRSAKFGVSAILYVSLFLGLLSALNWIAKKNNHRFDLTKEGVYSLSPQSKGIIENLKKPLKLVAFKGQENVNDEQLKDLFSLYKYANSSKVNSEVIDPRTRPDLVEKYEMKQGNVIFLQYGEDSDAKKSFSRINEASEQALTNAVLKLERGEAKKIYSVEGHGEARLGDTDPQGLKSFADALQDENLSIEGIFLGETLAIPEDAAAVLLVSPQQPLPQKEKDVLVKYAEEGGRLILFTDPQRPADVKEVASKFGISVSEDVVVDLVQRLFGPLALGAEIVARDYGIHPITRNLKPENVSIFNLASSVIAPKDQQAGDAPIYSELVSSGKNSWAERDLIKLYNPEQPSAEFLEETDLKGPVSLAVAYEKKLTTAGDAENKDEAKFDKVSRVVVFGDSDFILNQSLPSYANRDLILNTINWMVGEEGGLTIRPRSIRASAAPLTREQLIGLFSSSLLVPELLLLFGLFVWWSRRTVSR